MSNLAGVPEHARPEWQALCEALESSPVPIPCQGTRSREWLDTSRAATTYAATACLDCPAMQACAAYALTAREESGVWGGMTEADRRRAAKSGGAR